MKITVNEKKSEATADIYTKAVKKAFPKWPQKAIDLVSSWYENEDAADDYPTVASLANYIADDLPNMLDSADNAEYIRQVMADTDGGDLYNKVKDALKKVFPGRKYSVDGADSSTVGVSYSGKNKIPDAEFEAGLKKLSELLPAVTVVDYGGFGENSIGFEG